MYNPTVSVVINTHNRGPHLKRLLDALSRQTYDNFEVIVVNGPSTDNTEEVLERYGRAIRTDTCPVVNLCVSRNIGVKDAAGEIIAFIDDDAVPQDVRWIENAIKYFEDEIRTYCFSCCNAGRRRGGRVQQCCIQGIRR